MFTVDEEIARLLKKYPDPSKRGEGILEFARRQAVAARMPCLGTVVDSADPECLGRVRVASDMIAPGAVTNWLYVMRPWSSKDKGWWEVPAVGTQVLVAYIGKSPSRLIVVGCLYDRDHLPPAISTKKAADSVVWQTKNHRLEIINEGGKESISLHTAEGKMRLVLTKEKGIELINELGDIQIKCKKLIMEADKDIQVQAKKKLTVTGEDAFSLKGKKATKLINDKEVKLKGKNVKMDGSRGVATGGKQLAKLDDKVMGMDIHQMVIPAGTSTAVVPLPHPYIGKIADKVSEDVKIGGKGVAVKGSKSKHDDAMHMQLPGTIKFNANPNKEGEVTGGTAPKVKVNGKEVCVIGSMVTTCNDMGMQNNSTVLALGASMPMPMIINPKNMAEYKAEKEKEQTKKPAFTTLKWSKTSAKEGEEIELSAQVKDIADGNAVTFQIWKDGQDPASNIAQKVVSGSVAGGVAKALWQYRSFGTDIPPSEDPAFFFSAHSAWCPFKKSGNASVELKRPELSSLEWKDEETGSSSKGLVGKPLKMSVSCKDMEEGAGVVFRVFAEGANVERDQPVAEIAAENKGGKAEGEWQPFDTRDKGDTNKLTYFFTVSAPRAKEAKSSVIQVKNPQVISMEWEKKAIYYGEDVKLMITSREVAELNPEVVIQLWQVPIMNNDSAAYEEKVCLDNDGVDLPLTISLDEERFAALKEKQEMQFEIRVLCDTISFNSLKSELLWVGLREGRS